MPCFLRKLLSCFIFSRQRRHAFAGGWTGNKIIIVRRDGTEKVLSPFARIRGLHLKIDGSNNVLRLHEPFHFRGLRICLERGSRVSVAMADSIGAADWEVKDLTTFSVGSWEPSIDSEMLKRGRLHIYVQATAQGDGEKVADMKPQPVYVLEVKN